MELSTFRLDIFNSASAQIGSITEVFVSGWERNVSKRGGITLKIAAQVLAQAEVTINQIYYFKIYHTLLAYMGKFYIKDIQYDSATQVYIFNCDDQLIELVHMDTGYNLVYNGMTLAAILSALGLRMGWTIWTQLAENPYQQVIFVNENYLQAIDVIARYTNSYYALYTGDNDLFVGQFLPFSQLYSRYDTAQYNIDKYFSGYVGSSSISGYLYAVDGNTLRTLSNDYFSIVTQVTDTSEVGGVVNRIIPYGNGLFPLYETIVNPVVGQPNIRGAKVGEGYLNLGYSSRAPIKIKGVDTPLHIGDIVWDGAQKQYYMQEDNSVTLYGLRTKTMTESTLTPITTSDADVQNAANVLWDITKYDITALESPAITYSITVRNIWASLRPGYIVLFNYNGVVSTKFGDKSHKIISDYFYVTSIKANFDSSGNPVYTLELSSNGRSPTTYGEVISNAIGRIDAMQLRPVPNLAYYMNPSSTSPISAAYTESPSGTYHAALDKWFDFKFGDELLAINDLKVQVIVSKLKTYAYGSSQNGAINLNAGDPGNPVIPDPGNPTNHTATSPSDISHGHVIGLQAYSNVSIGDGITPEGLAYYIDYWRDNGWHLVFTKYDSVNNQYYLMQTQGIPGNIWAYQYVGPNNLTNHVHGAPIPVNDHDVSLPNHFHFLQWGVVEYPTKVSASDLHVYLNNAELTPMTFVSSSADDTEQIYEYNITQKLNTMQGIGMKTNTHKLRVATTSGMGMVFIKVFGRVTIQAANI